MRLASNRYINNLGSAATNKYGVILRELEEATDNSKDSNELSSTTLKTLSDLNETHSEKTGNLIKRLRTSREGGPHSDLEANKIAKDLNKYEFEHKSKVIDVLLSDSKLGSQEKENFRNLIPRFKESQEEFDRNSGYSAQSSIQQIKNEVERKRTQGSLLDDFADVNAEMPSYTDPED